jgi:hypothetical protein
MDEIPSTSGHDMDSDREWRRSGLEQEPPLGAHLTTSRRG